MLLSLVVVVVTASASMLLSLGMSQLCRMLPLFVAVVGAAIDCCLLSLATEREHRTIIAPPAIADRAPGNGNGTLGHSVIAVVVSVVVMRMFIVITVVVRVAVAVLYMFRTNLFIKFRRTRNYTIAHAY